MKIKWQSFLLFGFLLLFLTGCNQVEDILTRVNEMLDDQLASKDSEQTEQAEDENMDASAQNEEVFENETNNMTTDETYEADGEIGSNEANEANDTEGTTKLNNATNGSGNVDLQNVEGLDPPNGLPIMFPDYWILMEDNAEDMTAEQYEAVFCFNTDKDLEQIMTDFGSEYDYFHYETSVDPQYGPFHNADFYHHFGSEELYGYFQFYLEENGNKCSWVTLSFEALPGIFGEDPATMYSDTENE